ncbi:DUF4040 domain-containing protein [Ancylobacter sonchi]|uniref:hydrogenase subunit MbhD domain-containing protein n=1 Tax=Ancylobacter sonchi TaxID=1937790 RepID=UPI001BD4AA1D|nr:hydrogenase subunit MbhD domain-containing protein [Ancylobacter sonchi]MBS7536464.1 DUF4040 domain-containing protein [Ancylobacter sonchi]
MTELLALTLALPLLAGALFIVATASTRAALFGFFAFGLFLALAWVALDAVDVALTEAAIGGGATGLLLLRLNGRMRHPVSLGEPAGPRLKIAAGLLAALVTLALGALLLALPEPAPSLAAATVEPLPTLGIGNPVAAVLIAYRALDTLLEIVVLLIAVVGLRALGTDRGWGGRPVPWPEGGPSPALVFLARLLIPAGLVFAAYLFWVGADAPGGKFQASTLLAALWLLAIMAGLAPAPSSGGRWTGRALAIGPLAFIAAGAIGIAAAGSFLAWPEPVAKPMIIAVELALAVSIVVALVLLVAGPPERETGR